MNRLQNRLGKILLTLLLGLAIFGFWRWQHPAALAFQEQFQLFLFDDDYFLSRLTAPGGMACYVAEFLVQFYNNVTIGALIVACLFMLLQRMTWRLMRPVSGMWYGLSFLPAVLMWMAMGDESVMLTSLVALLMVLAAMLGCPKGGRVRAVYAAVSIPLAYWLAGPLALGLALYIPWRRPAVGSVAKCLMMAAACVVVVAVCVAVSAYLLPYPLKRLSIGLYYYRFVEVMPTLLWMVAALALLLAVGSSYLPVIRRPRGRWAVLGGSFLLLAVVAAVAVPRAYDERKYTLMDYDYLVRANRWETIIQKSERRQADLPVSVCATNLALAMTGQLGERAFDFFQHGAEGLLPRFERNFVSLQLIGEAYFQLGLVNTAQRMTFEAMEAIPNYNKSARAVKRLAETNLINGQYAVAQKYLNMLKKTIFYRNWALRTELLLSDEKQIDAHPLYGRLRKVRLSEDFLFSEQEVDKICGQLFMHNSKNVVAVQYLLLFPLLEGDIAKFMNYVQVVNEKEHYAPRTVQQGIAWAYMSKGQMPPEGVAPAIVQQLRAFVQTYKSVGRGAPQLQQYRNTVWYYLTEGE